MNIQRIEGPHGQLAEAKRARDKALAVLKEADVVLEEWIGILQANGLRHSAIDGEALRTKIAALLPNSHQ